MKGPIPTGAKFHVTERDGVYWLAMSYPKQALKQGAANKRLHPFGDNLAEAEAVAVEMNKRAQAVQPRRELFAETDPDNWPDGSPTFGKGR